MGVETAETRNYHCFFFVWVYFEHEGFESGFRDLTLCVKALRQEAQRERFVVPLEPIEPSRV